MNLKSLIENHSPESISPSDPYIIAEAGVNHEGDIKVARRLIDEAAEGGADAIKFQSYKADKLASRDSPAYWDLAKEPTESQYRLFKKYDKFWKAEYEELAKHCQTTGIEFLSTPFDRESADFLNELMPVYKVSSSDLNNKPFIEYLCRYRKPLILSTGASWMWEVEQTVSWIRGQGVSFALLHCILNYPTNDDSANLLMIRSLLEKFPNNIVGYSDHTLPKDMKTIEVASILGAKILEKHFTHDKNLPGNDHYHSMDKEDLKVFRRRWNNIKVLMGQTEKHPIESEQVARLNARRSLVAARPIKKGHIIQADDVTWKRPATGIDPRDLSKLLGMRATRFIQEDVILQWNQFDGD